MVSANNSKGGSNADNILADGYIKGLSTGIDVSHLITPEIIAKINISQWNLGYEAVVNDAEVEPFDWCCEGRGGLDSWKALDCMFSSCIMSAF